MLVLTNNYSDGGHSAVLRTLPFVSLNMRVCGFVTLRPNALATFLLANVIILPMIGDGTSHTRWTLGVIGGIKERLKRGKL